MESGERRVEREKRRKSINNKVILKDGGSIVYKKNDIYIVMCHRIGSLDADKTIEDIYLGDTYQDVCLE